MFVERESVVVDAGDLVHRAISESDPDHHEVRLIPCIAWWIGRERYRVVDAAPTCVQCIAARIQLPRPGSASVFP